MKLYICIYDRIWTLEQKPPDRKDLDLQNDNQGELPPYFSQ
jgi:hypothetical protein